MEGLRNDVAPELLGEEHTAQPAGNTLGPYRVVSRLGEGGMGDVYLAQDTRETNLQRKVALKVMRQRFPADREGVQRFKQEAYAASALNHPNIQYHHCVRDRRAASDALYSHAVCRGPDFAKENGVRANRRSGMEFRSRMRLQRRTMQGLCIAISSPPTSCWAPTAT